MSNPEYTTGTHLLNVISPIPLMTKTPGTVTSEEQIHQTMKSTLAIGATLALGRAILTASMKDKDTEERNLMRSQLAARTPELEFSTTKEASAEMLGKALESGKEWAGAGADVARDIYGGTKGLLLKVFGTPRQQRYHEEARNKAKGITSVSKDGRGNEIITYDQNALPRVVDATPNPPEPSTIEALKDAFRSNGPLMLTTLGIAVPSAVAIYGLRNLWEESKKKRLDNQRKKMEELERELNAIYREEFVRLKGTDKYASEPGTLKGSYNMASKLYAMYAILAMVGGAYLTEAYFKKNDPNKERKRHIEKLISKRSKVEEGPEFIYMPKLDAPSTEPRPSTKSLAPIKMVDQDSLLAKKERLLQERNDMQEIAI